MVDARDFIDTGGPGTPNDGPPDNDRSELRSTTSPIDTEEPPSTSPIVAGIQAAAESLTAGIADLQERCREFDQKILTAESSVSDYLNTDAQSVLAYVASIKENIESDLKNLRRSCDSNIESMARVTAQCKVSLSQVSSPPQSVETEVSLEKQLEKTAPDYILDGVWHGFEALKKSMNELPLTIESAKQLVDEMELNKHAVSRVSSSRAKFVPDKTIVVSILNSDYSALRRVPDYCNFKDLILLDFDRFKLNQGLECTDFNTDIREYPKAS